MHEKKASLCRSHQLNPGLDVSPACPFSSPLLVAWLCGKWPPGSQETPRKRWGRAILPFIQLEKPNARQALNNKGSEQVKHGDCSAHAAHKLGSTGRLSTHDAAPSIWILGGSWASLQHRRCLLYRQPC